jgi:hypothetical protein
MVPKYVKVRPEFSIAWYSRCLYLHGVLKVSRSANQPRVSAQLDHLCCLSARPKPSVNDRKSLVEIADGLELTHYWYFNGAHSQIPFSISVSG